MGKPTAQTSLSSKQGQKRLAKINMLYRVFFSENSTQSP